MSIGSRQNRRARTQQQFADQLTRQSQYLERSCQIFDAGEYDEAIRIAVALRTMLRDTRSATSLISHLGLKDRMKFFDTGVHRELLTAAWNELLKQSGEEGEIAAFSPSEVGLVELGDAGGGRVGWFAPLLLNRWVPGSPPHRATKGLCNFKEWWETSFIESTSGKSFSRADLIGIMADQDGGAHVDAGIDADYDDLCVDFLGICFAHGVDIEKFSDDIPPALHNVAFASVRQIAFEVQISLQWHNISKDNPGIFVMGNPMSRLTMPKIPHKAMHFPEPIVIGKFA